MNQKFIQLFNFVIYFLQLDYWAVYSRSKNISDELLANAKDILLKSGAVKEGSDEILFKVNQEN